MPPPLRRRTPKTTVLYAAVSASSSPSTATSARGAATREAGSPRPLSKLEIFPPNCRLPGHTQPQTKCSHGGQIDRQCRRRARVGSARIESRSRPPTLSRALSATAQSNHKMHASLPFNMLECRNSTYQRAHGGGADRGHVRAGNARQLRHHQAARFGRRRVVG